MLPAVLENTLKPGLVPCQRAPHAVLNPVPLPWEANRCLWNCGLYKAKHVLTIHELHKAGRACLPGNAANGCWGPHSPSPLIILMPTSQSICLDYGRFKISPRFLEVPWCTVQPHKHVQPALLGCTHSKSSQEDRSPQKCPEVSWERSTALQQGCRNWGWALG